jgi:hypothetical protein
MSRGKLVDKAMLIDVKRVMELLSVPKTRAYEVIKLLNKELEEHGFLVVRGRVPEKYLRERYGID